MSLELWLAFVAASALLLLMPGPTILTVIGYTLAHGRRVLVPLVAAVVLGDTTALALSLLGLGALLKTSAFWFTVIKSIGGLYLLYLGIRMLMDAFRKTPSTAEGAAENAAAGTEEALPPYRRLFANTYFVTALNPKGMIFFIAFLPQFIDHNLATAPQLWILASTFVVMALINTTFYVLFAGNAVRFLATPKARRIFNISGGVLLCTAGSWALLARQGE